MKDSIKPKYFGRDLEAMTFATNYHRWIVDEFRPFLGDVIVEVGAGSGNLTCMLLEETDIKQLVAFEPSVNMYPLLQQAVSEHNNANCINAFFGEKCGNFKEHFDSITYVNVLEHVQDDETELSYMYQALKPGGHILIFVPALSWLYSEVDRQVGHYRRYHAKNLVSLVQAAGFDIVKAKYFDIAGILPWYIAFVLLKQTPTRSNVSIYDRFVVPVMRKVESIVTPPIGKNILLIARKI